MRRLAALLVAALLVTAAVPGGVAAQDDDGGLLDGMDGPGGLLDAIRAGFSAANDAIGSLVRSASYQVTGPDRTPAEQADATAAVVNNNSDALVNYTNARFSGSATAWDVVAVEFTNTDTDETATRYLVATTENGSFTSVEMVETTNRTVDATLGLEDAAAANADRELTHFVEAYVDEDRALDTALRSRLSAYAGDIDLPDGVMA